MHNGMFPLKDNYLRRKYAPEDPEAAVEAVEDLLEEEQPVDEVLDATGPYWTYALLEGDRLNERSDQEETFQVEMGHVAEVARRLDRYIEDDADRGRLRTAAGYASKPLKLAWKPVGFAFLDGPYRAGRASARYEGLLQSTDEEAPGSISMKGAGGAKAGSLGAMMGGVAADAGFTDPALSAPFWLGALGGVAAEPAFKGRAAAYWEGHVEDYIADLEEDHESYTVEAR